MIFADQREVPNQLKRNTWARSTKIIKLRNFKQLPLDQEVSTWRPMVETILIHIAQGIITLTRTDRKCTGKVKTHTISSGNAYELTEEEQNANCWVIWPKTDDVVLIIEEIIKESVCPHVQEKLPEKYLNMIDQGESVVLETNANCVFLASRHAIGDKIMLPIQVSLIAMDGSILHNNLICPRQQVKCYKTDTHGLKEEDLYHAEDEYAAYKKLLALVSHKIVVGCNIGAQLSALRLPVGCTSGVREFTTNRLFGKPTENERWNMVALMKHACEKFKIKYEFPQQALQEAKLVHLVFDQIKKEWKDDFVKSGLYDKVKTVTVEKTVIEDMTQSLRNSTKKLSCSTQQLLSELPGCSTGLVQNEIREGALRALQSMQIMQDMRNKGVIIDKKQMEDQLAKIVEETREKAKQKMEDEKERLRKQVEKELKEEQERLDKEKQVMELEKEVVDLDEIFCDPDDVFFDLELEDQSRMKRDQIAMSRLDEEATAIMWVPLKNRTDERKEFLVGTKYLDWDELTKIQKAAWSLSNEERKRKADKDQEKSKRKKVVGNK